jgi:tetratricopeptide (TPR) repeat protein
MRHALSMLCAAIGLVVGAAGHAAAETAQAAVAHSPALTERMAEYRRDIGDARSNHENREYRQACRRYARLVKDKRSAGLTPEERRELFGAAGRAMVNCDRVPRAVEYLQQATRETADADDYYRLSLTAEYLKRYDLSLDAYLEFIARWPELADQSDTQHIISLYRAFSDRPEQQIRLLQAVFDARFDDPVRNITDMWYELARLHLDRGDLDKARAAAKRVNHPNSVVQMRIDRRFDPIVDRTAYGFDVSLEAQRSLDTMRGKAEARPRDLAVWVELTDAMLDANQNEEIIALTTKLLDSNEGGPDSNVKVVKFENFGKRIWLLNNRALALYRLGRADDAVDDLKRAIASDSDGEGQNVNQTLNLGLLQCYSGYPQEAVERVAAVQNLSTHGKNVRALVHLCAATQRGDRKGIARALRVMRAHADESPSFHLEGLLWAGRLEEAERVYLRLLDDPSERAGALILAQTFRTAPHKPGARVYEDMRRALLARPAVRSAIDKVGRVEQFDIHDGHDYD